MLLVSLPGVLLVATAVASSYFANFDNKQPCNIQGANNLEITMHCFEAPIKAHLFICWVSLMFVVIYLERNEQGKLVKV